MNPFLTTYRKDYLKKVLKSNERYKIPSEFKDPITEGFKKYLQLSSVEPPPNLPIEDADKYLDQYRVKHDELAKRYFTEPINNEIVQKTFIYNGRTVYQVDFCNLASDLKFKEDLENKSRVTLPDDWVIPLTTQNHSYRNPKTVNSRAYEPTPQLKPPNCLGFDENIRKIKKVVTGDSEYHGVICHLGTTIIEHELHGKVVHAKCTCLIHNPSAGARD